MLLCSLTLHRFTYAISFAALVAATAGISDYWETPKGIQGGILFFLVPAVLVVINAFGIEVRWYYDGVEDTCF
jgi:amino acid transporter